MISLLLVIIISYLIGAIPTSLLTGRILRGIDIREHGSGNAGATNVFRVLGWKPGAGVLLFDIFKGFAATFWIAKLAFPAVAIEPQTVQLIAGCSAIIGHIWPVFSGFRGGKGVGTAAGMLLALLPLTLVICLAVFALSFWITRIVSASSILATLSFPGLLTLWRYAFHHQVADSIYFFSFLAAALIVFTHRTNVKRLFRGTENKFKQTESS